MYERLGIPAGVYMFDRPCCAGNFGFARFEWDDATSPMPTDAGGASTTAAIASSCGARRWPCGSDDGDNGLEAQRLGFLAPGGWPMRRRRRTASSSTSPTPPRAPGAANACDFVRRYDISTASSSTAARSTSRPRPTRRLDRRPQRPRGAQRLSEAQAAAPPRGAAAARGAGDFVLISRAGYAGAQKLRLVWGGDIPGSEPSAPVAAPISVCAPRSSR